MPDYREKALAEHGHQCTECGATDNIEVHHIDRDRSNNAIENLEVLCRSCHGDRHKKLGDDPVEVTVPMMSELNGAIEDQLEYGDSKSGYIRQAIRDRLFRDHLHNDN